MANAVETSTGRRIGRLAAIGLVAAAAAGFAVSMRHSAAEELAALPPPALDEAPTQAATEVAVLAGGCFWGVQGVFQHVDGVITALSGYAGGEQSTAQYGEVGSGATGHAESVSVTFDPRQISYGQILQIYFSVAHDPTQLDRQGPDYGSQYRSAIFPANPDQARVAAAYIAQLDQAHAFASPIATRIEPGKSFYPAEAYHQDFLTRNPNHPYIAINDIPKVEALQRLFPSHYRPTPVLVASAETAG
jgi:peptide-methionine (S)-S-oxide reductase